MSEVNFQELLSAKPEDVKRPDPVPVGTYLGIVTGFKLDVSRQKKTPFVHYEIKPVSPQEDVDMESFQKFGGSEKLTSKVMGIDYYLSADAQWRLKEFLEKLGVVFGGRSWQAVIPEAVQKQVKFHVMHKLNADRPADPPFAQIDDITAA